jgi:hypothetical protein
MSLSFTSSDGNYTSSISPSPDALSINHTRILYANISGDNIFISNNSDNYTTSTSDGPYTALYLSYDGSVLVAVSDNSVYHFKITETVGSLSVSGPITLLTGVECTHVSISYDGNHVLLSANNVVSFYGIYDDPPDDTTTFGIDTIYDGNSLVNSISLSGNGQHIAIGLLDIGIVSFLINSGRVLTFMVPYEGNVIQTGYMERRIGNENFGKSISLDYAGTTIAIGIPGYDKINESLTTGQQPTENTHIITIKNGLVSKYVYDDGWTIYDTINNPVTGDTSGTFGENVYLSPSGNIIVTIVDDKYYEDGVGSPLADVTNVKFVGEQPVYITNSQLISSAQSLPTDTYIPYKRLYPSTPDNILTRTKKITSLASTSSILAVSTTRNVHIYKINDSEYIHAYDLLSNGKIYNDISNLSLRPDGSYLAVEHSTYISIFTISSTMQLELLSKIQNKYVKFRDIVWSSGALIIGSQDVTIVYDLTTGVYNTYNTIYNIYRIIGDNTLFTYTPGTVIKYNYTNNTKDTYPIVVSGVGVIENFPDDDTKIALGIPQEKIVTIYNLPPTTNHISFDGGLYSGFGKKIDIINGANGEIKIVISSDEYIHVYDYDTSTQSFSGYVPYYIMSSESRYITTNEGIFIIDEERKSVSFKSM